MEEPNTLEADANSQKGNDDLEVSSIEALNWSDFEEDEEILCAKRDTSSGSTHLYLSDSLIRSQTSHSDADSEEETQKSVVLNQEQSDIPKKTKSGRSAGTKKRFGRRYSNDKNSKRMSSSNFSEANSEGKEDYLSHASVHDEGPIWSKGAKSYRFRENRRFNQKLTLGVLFSVILAIGLGLGNLVAFNECEAEYKNYNTGANPTNDPPPGPSQQFSLNTPPQNPPPSPPKPIHTDFNQGQNQKKDIPKYIAEKEILSDSEKIPTAPHKFDKEFMPILKTPPNGNIRENREFLRPNFDFNTPPKTKELDPKYAQQAEILASVVKSLDELSRKIDKFENTTRHLGGIIMMKDDILEEPNDVNDASINSKIENEVPKEAKEEMSFMSKLSSIINENGFEEGVESTEDLKMQTEKQWDDLMDELLGILEAQEAKAKAKENSKFKPGKIYSVDNGGKEKIRYTKPPDDSNKPILVRNRAEDFLDDDKMVPEIGDEIGDFKQFLRLKRAFFESRVPTEGQEQSEETKTFNAEHKEELMKMVEAQVAKDAEIAKNNGLVDESSSNNGVNENEKYNRENEMQPIIIVGQSEEDEDIEPPRISKEEEKSKAKKEKKAKKVKNEEINKAKNEENKKAKFEESKKWKNEENKKAKFEESKKWKNEHKKGKSAENKKWKKSEVYDKIKEKDEGRDWQSGRATGRDQLRSEEKKKEFNGKKAKNWQMEREKIREKMRNNK